MYFVLINFLNPFKIKCIKSYRGEGKDTDQRSIVLPCQDSWNEKGEGLTLLLFYIKIYLSGA
jgi:hypothetical protein